MPEYKLCLNSQFSKMPFSNGFPPKYSKSIPSAAFDPKRASAL